MIKNRYGIGSMSENFKWVGQDEAEVKQRWPTRMAA